MEKKEGGDYFYKNNCISIAYQTGYGENKVL